MSQAITIQPITRIEGHASIKIWLDDAGNYQMPAKLHVPCGVSRNSSKASRRRSCRTSVCRICASALDAPLGLQQAVDRCFGVTRRPAGHKLRELMQTIAHAEDKLLHFYFWRRLTLSSARTPTTPSVTWSGSPRPTRSWRTQVVKTRYMVKISWTNSRARHPSPSPGGRRLLQSRCWRRSARTSSRKCGRPDCALFTSTSPRRTVFPKYLDAIKTSGDHHGFIGTVRRKRRPQPLRPARSA